MYRDYFKNIGLINLKKRPDRLALSSGILNEFGANYEVIEAVENIEKPCEGLVVTMQNYFRRILKDGAERCLLFEDDIQPLTDCSTWNNTISRCVEQLPNDWDMLYLGCNPAGGLTKFYSENLLPIPFAYATHAVAYSRRTMQFITDHAIHEPIDNFLVREFQIRGAKCFVSYPLLFTQRPNHSDIGGNWTDWSMVIERRYDEQIRRLITDRNNALRR